MNKAHTNINWENYPNTSTPLNETNLNKMDSAIDLIDDRVIAHENTKATKEEVSTLVQNIEFEESTGIFKITKKNGSVLTIDTKMEKIAVNFSYDSSTEQIALTLIDGTIQYIDLTSLITQYEFMDTDTIGFEITSDGEVKATVLDGSITEDKLQPNYLADIKVEVAKAQASQQAAEVSEANSKASEIAAKNSEKNAEEKAVEAENSATSATNSANTAVSNANIAENSAYNAKISEKNAFEYAETAEASAVSASTSEENAKTSESNAASSATAAKTSETNADSSASTASSKANAASTAATNAANSAISAANSAASAESYATGATNSAKYYYEQTQSISESFAGTLRPKGTVAFANLPSLSSAEEGDMYNISDQFVTTADFKEGVGNTIPAGANVYKTSDGKWDILAGSPVTGIKGNSESSYRRGNVNITPANIGLGNVPNVSTNDQTPTFSQASSRTNLISGEKISTLFGKIMKWFADLKAVAFSGSYNDLTDKPTIPTVGNGTITITQNGTTKGTFTTNQSGNTTIALTDTNTDTNNTYSAGRGISLNENTFNLADVCVTITDWNNAMTTGWYMAYNASNAPISSAWFYGEVITHSTVYLRQILYQFSSDTNVLGTNCDRYERVRNNGVWGEWVNTSVQNYLPLSGGTMVGDINLPNNKCIVQNQRDTSNYTMIAKWLKNGVSRATFDPHIGHHNTGDSTENAVGEGSICIVPFATDKQPWLGGVGLFITKNEVRHNGSTMLHVNNYQNYALPLMGGVVKGKITERQGHYVHNTPGVAGKTGYVAVAEITVKGTYSNQPFEITFARRGDSTPTKLSIVFLSVNSTDPGISSFICMGSSTQAYLYKTGTSTWKLYIEKTQGYDNIAILDFSQGAYLENSIWVTWMDELSETLPDGAIQASVGYTVGTAQNAEKLGDNVTAQWSGQISSTDWFAAFNPNVDGQIRCMSVESVKKVLGVGESASSPLGTVYNIIWSGHTYVYSYNSSYTDISVNVNNIFAYSYLILEGNIHYPDSGYNPTHRFTIPLMLGKNVIDDGQNIVKGVLPVFELIDQNYAIYNKLNIVLSELEYKISSDILSVISFKLNPNSGFGVVLGSASDGVISAKYSDEVYFSISQICGVA